jgi:hypothetical protein
LTASKADHYQLSVQIGKLLPADQPKPSMAEIDVIVHAIVEKNAAAKTGSIY